MAAIVDSCQDERAAAVRAAVEAVRCDGVELCARLVFRVSRNELRRVGITTPAVLYDELKQVFWNAEEGVIPGDHLSVGFGEVDRCRQVRAFAERHAGQPRNVVAKAYEREYGFSAGIAAIWLDLFTESADASVSEWLVAEVAELPIDDEAACADVPEARDVDFMRPCAHPALEIRAEEAAEVSIDSELRIVASRIADCEPDLPQEVSSRLASDMRIPIRALNVFSNNRIETVADLLGKTKGDLLAYDNFDISMLDDVVGELVKVFEQGLAYFRVSDKRARLSERLSISNELREMPIAKIEMTTRISNTFEREGISVVGDVLDMSEEELLAFEGFDGNSFEDLVGILEGVDAGLLICNDDLDKSAVSVSDSDTANCLLNNGSQQTIDEVDQSSVADARNSFSLEESVKCSSDVILDSSEEGNSVDAGSIFDVIDAVDETDMEETREPIVGPEDILGMMESIFRSNALIGNAILTEESVTAVLLEGQSALDKKMGDRFYRLSRKEKMALTLSVIEYAKGWSFSKRSSLWGYLVARFGYKDDKVQSISSLIKTSLSSCFSEFNKYFAFEFGENRYKATILAHALAPADNWLTLCDLLFDFLSENLGGSWAPGDPSICKMTFALRDRFRDLGEDEDSPIDISSTSYFIQEGIRRLVVNRPYYASSLFESIIGRMLKLQDGSSTAPALRQDLLCDKWWSEKISKGSSRNGRATNRGVAVSVDGFKPAFRFEDGEILLCYPSLRLPSEDFQNLTLAYLLGGRVVARYPFRISGNEFGKTAIGFDHKLSDLEGSGIIESLSIRIQLLQDNSVMYDSQDMLFRDVLLFRDGKEVSLDDCSVDEYLIAVRAGVVLDRFDIAIAPVSKPSGMKTDLYYANFKAGFMLKADGSPVCQDLSSGNPAASIALNHPWPGVEYYLAGRRFDVVSKKDDIVVCVADIVDLDKLIVRFNGRVYQWCENECDFESGRLVIPLDRTGHQDAVVQVSVGESGEVICSRRIHVVDSLRYEFDRAFYFSEQDYLNACITCVIDGVEARTGFTSADRCASLQHGNGYFDIVIPKVVLLGSDNEWGSGFASWVGGVSNDAIRFETPDGVAVSVFADGIEVPRRRNGYYAIGASLSDAASSSNYKEWVSASVVLSLKDGDDKRRYPLGRFSVRERFVSETPHLEAGEGEIRWDMGGRFLGSRDGRFEVEVYRDSTLVWTHALDLDSPVISDDCPLDDGEYKYVILRKSDNVFSMTSHEIVSGYFVGDQDELRFEGKRIILEAAYYEDSDGNSRSVEIDPVYIEPVRFLKMVRSNSEGAGIEYPRYVGVAYALNSRGKLIEYSHSCFKARSGDQVIALNPVVIDYINDEKLYLADRDLDAPYCYRPPQGYCWRLTDRDVGNTNRYGHLRPILPDQFAYTTDRTTDA